MGWGERALGSVLLKQIFGRGMRNLHTLLRPGHARARRQRNEGEGKTRSGDEGQMTESWGM